MYRTEYGGYKCYKRVRKNSLGNKYTELLFLDKDIPLKLIKESDKRNRYHSNIKDKYGWPVEDRSVDIKLLNEVFVARIIRPYNSWFNGQQSYGIEIAILLSEYFNIKIYKRKYYEDKEGMKVMFRTFPANEYLYDIRKIKRSDEATKIPLEDICPYSHPERNYYHLDDPYECYRCPFWRGNIKESEKDYKLCYMPKLTWRK